MPPEAIGILNSGSSSIKFALFAVEDEQLRATATGQIDGIYNEPRFIAKADGKLKAERVWGKGVNLGHQSATEYLLTYLRQELVGTRLLGVGHRVVHGGLIFKQPVRVDRGVLRDLEKLIPLAHCTSLTILPQFTWPLNVRRICSKWPASTPSSTPHHPK